MTHFAATPVRPTLVSPSAGVNMDRRGQSTRRRLEAIADTKLADTQGFTPPRLVPRSSMQSVLRTVLGCEQVSVSPSQ